MGGYVSGPGGVAAWLSGIPVVLHEQNAVAGLTNQWLSKIATKVFQAFPGAFPHAQVVGNPVREGVTQLVPPQERWQARQTSDDIRILVMGGSQGAQILNTTLPKVLNQLGTGYTVWHQAGRNNAESVQQAYLQQANTQNNTPQANVVEFIDDVAQAYAWADIVVCRSGALTVSEIAAAGVGAIFIPFMHKDRQQALNGDHLVACGGAKMIEQPDLSVDNLSQMIAGFDRDELLAMALSARKAAQLDADKTVAQAIIDLAS
jgi:UDP-N-acetylglucosamine--N-acetylmuramyl-(pentapeptide) pyrophosphoryl-undecaprenol N-acetylglucosamine transferase